MKVIKELADKIIKEVWQSPHAMTAGLHADLTQFAQRLIAAYVDGLEEQRGNYSDIVSDGGFDPRDAAPPLTEPAPAVDPQRRNQGRRSRPAGLTG